MTTSAVQQGAEAGPASPTAPEDLPVVRLRHPWRWVSYAVIAVLAAMLVHSLVTNPHFGWHVVGEYLTSVRILDGLLKTLQLTVIAMAVGIVLGVVLAVMRLSDNPVLSRT